VKEANVSGEVWQQSGGGCSCHTVIAVHELMQRPSCCCSLQPACQTRSHCTTAICLRIGIFPRLRATLLQ
jgi:hypothetical protein